jgi:hypothetical protein
MKRLRVLNFLVSMILTVAGAAAQGLATTFEELVAGAKKG